MTKNTASGLLSRMCPNEILIRTQTLKQISVPYFDFNSSS